MDLDTLNKQMKEASGNVRSSNPVVDFLYHLMRDHLPAADVQDLMRHVTPGASSEFTNGWLAQQAQFYANILAPSVEETQAELQRMRDQLKAACDLLGEVHPKRVTQLAMRWGGDNGRTWIERRIAGEQLQEFAEKVNKFLSENEH